MKRSKRTMEPTELEGAVLAVIANDGECTRYRVKSVFEKSPADVWSGSAGTIYPMMSRLMKAGLVQERPTMTGKRASKLVSLTAAGEAVLEKWLVNVDRGASIGFDPMRTRLYYQNLYDRDVLATYVGEVIRNMEETIPPPKSALDAMAEIHGVWLRHRRQALEEILAIILKSRGKGNQQG